MALKCFLTIFYTRAYVLMILLPLLFSCATYNNKLANYYGNLASGHFEKARNEMKASRFMNTERNKLLYYFERGKLFHLMQNYDSSNHYFNLADDFIESKRKNMLDVAKANVLNPMMQTYMGEDFERFMIHYYKALNYIKLNQLDGARVEARRITLTTHALQDKFKPLSDRYKEDAFALNVQGLIYEAYGEYNNAFISYRNALELYLGEPYRIYYGVAMPKTLVKDLYRAAAKTGFNDQIADYERRTGVPYKDSTSEGGEVVIFVEKGMAPIKAEQRFTLTNMGGNIFNFNGPFGRMNIPFDFTYAAWAPTRSLSEFNLVTVALPLYQIKNDFLGNASVLVNGNSYKAEMIHNINELAPQILRERYVKEVSLALVRAVVKKALELGVSSVTKKVSKSGKNENSGEGAALAAGLLMNIFNSASEKADTRNWQSLPAFIQYVRIPLKRGANEITLKGMGRERKITFNGNGGLQLYNWCLFR
jgi:uncharacterized protein